MNLLLTSILIAMLIVATLSGCAASRASTDPASVTLSRSSATPLTGVDEGPVITPVAFQDQEDDESLPPTEPVADGDLLAELVAAAQAANPSLRRLEQEAASAWDRVPQVRALPDPMVEGTVFGEPMMMGDGRQRGTFMVSQMLPWFRRLDAQGQQAAYEAMMLQQEVNAERLRIAADVKSAWYRLYLLGQQIRINEANSELLESLIEVASSRIAVGEATQGDVLLATVELGRLEEELITFRQQVASSRATLNRLLNRPSETPIPIPGELDVNYAAADLDQLRALAAEYQPDIAAAQLRTQATAWGVCVARLQRVPDVTLLYERMFMEMDAPHGGSDPWRVGAGINLPIWSRKYDAIESEAARRHFAANAAVEEVVREYDARIFDLLEQARAAQNTSRLYGETLLPQARQTLDADQQAYAQGQVEFDRVIADVRNVLLLEIGHRRAQTDLATALAELERAVGIDWRPVAQRPAPFVPPIPGEPDTIDRTGQEDPPPRPPRTQ